MPGPRLGVSYADQAALTQGAAAVYAGAMPGGGMQQPSQGMAGASCMQVGVGGGMGGDGGGSGGMGGDGGQGGGQGGGTPQNAHLRHDGRASPPADRRSGVRERARRY